MWQFCYVRIELPKTAPQSSSTSEGKGGQCGTTGLLAAKKENRGVNMSRTRGMMGNYMSQPPICWATRENKRRTSQCSRSDMFSVFANQEQSPMKEAS